jgi:hypothetical protein
MTPALRLLTRDVADALEIDPLLLSTPHASAPPGAKALLYLLAVEITKLSHADISRAFGLSDHSAVINACHRARKRIRHDAVTQALYQRIKAKTGPYLLLEELRQIDAEIVARRERARVIAGLLGLRDEQEATAAE